MKLLLDLITCQNTICIIIHSIREFSACKNGYSLSTCMNFYGSIFTRQKILKKIVHFLSGWKLFFVDFGKFEK